MNYSTIMINLSFNPSLSAIVVVAFIAAKLFGGGGGDGGGGDGDGGGGLIPIPIPL